MTEDQRIDIETARNLLNGVLGPPGVDRLYQVAVEAREYYLAVRRDDRHAQKVIIGRTVQFFTAAEAVYFCTEVASNLEQHAAHMALTVLANRLVRPSESPEATDG